MLREDELRTNDGQEGRPAYIAYEGKVYDVSESRLWRKGVHVRRHHAGADLTADLTAAPHDASVFERVPLVGELAEPEPVETVKCEPQENKTLAALLDFYFEQHPHPVVVHFPVALSVVAAVFLVLYLITDVRAFETSCYYVMWAAAIMGPVAVLTGAFSWWLNYGHKLNRAFQTKIGFAIVFILLSAIAVLVRTREPDALVNRDALGWLYVMLVLATAPIVTILGRTGASILFPSSK